MQPAMRTGRGPGRPAGGDPARTRAALLHAAREVFAERGYAGAGTNEIVGRAGLTPSALYHHFGSKANLYTAVFEEIVDAVLARIDAATAECTTFLDRLDAVLEVVGDVEDLNRLHSPFTISVPYEVRRHPELDGAKAQLRRIGGAFFGPPQQAEPAGLFERIIDDRTPQDPLVAIGVTLFWGVGILTVGDLDKNAYRRAIDAIRTMVAGLYEEQGDPRSRAAVRLRATPELPK